VDIAVNAGISERVEWTWAAERGAQP